MYKIMFSVFTILLFDFSLAFAAGKEGGSQTNEFVSIDNQKTGLTWRFYHNVKGNRMLHQGFCQDPANNSGNNWRLPIRKEFEMLIADPEFKFPSDLSAEYYSREVRNIFGHATTLERLVSNLDLDTVDVENSDALVFDVANKKWNWRFVTNEYSVACVAPMK
jgi:hypothetical protein